LRRRRRESSRTATKRCGGFVNEGIRVSRLLAFIGEQDYPPERKALVDELAAPARVEMPGPLPAAATPAPTERFFDPDGVTVPFGVTVQITPGRRRRFRPRESRATRTTPNDTFHFTKCTPQRKDFNRSQLRWAGLEDYILEHAENLDFRVTVFTGPVLAADDAPYRGVQLPPRSGRSS